MFRNAKTFLKVFLYWCLFIDLNVSVYQWQIKVNNSRLSIAYFCAKNKNSENLITSSSYHRISANSCKNSIITLYSYHILILSFLTSFTTLNIFHSFMCTIRYILIPHTTEINSSIAFCRTPLTMKIILLTLHDKED